MCHRHVASHIPPCAARSRAEPRPGAMERALHARDQIGVEDFVLLEDYQSQDAFVDNLSKRFKADLIYVSDPISLVLRDGTVLLIVLFALLSCSTYVQRWFWLFNAIHQVSFEQWLPSSMTLMFAIYFTSQNVVIRSSFACGLR